MPTPTQNSHQSGRHLCVLRFVPHTNTRPCSLIFNGSMKNSMSVVTSALAQRLPEDLGVKRASSSCS